jgi:NAD(P)-dependent dehydrogenase (short-subunit alcohol dehydrogenase family)
MLSNKVVVIAGAAGLLGKHFARSAASKGAAVVLADLNVEKLQKIKNDVENLNWIDKLDVMVLDVTNKKSIIDLIESTVDKHGRIDAVVNATYPRNPSYGKDVENVEYSDFCENLNLHLGGYFLLAQQCCIYFRKQGSGNLINLASIYGSMAPRFQVYRNTKMTMPVEYAAIKSGIIQLTRYFSQYYKGCGLRVNSLSPGGILDGQSELFLKAYEEYSASKGMLDPGDLTGALLFLLSDESRFINGQNLIVDDGFSL